MTDAATGSIVWTDEVDPARAVSVAGAKMGRLAELARAV